MSTLIIVMVCIYALIVIFINNIVAITMQRKYWKIYEEVYNKLPEMKFERNHSQIYSGDYHGLLTSESNDCFIWFMDDDEFLVSRNIYLFNFSLTKADPVSKKWLKKYQEWFKQNPEIQKLIHS